MWWSMFTNKSISAIFISNQKRPFINKALYLRTKLSDFVTGHRYSPHRTVAFNGYQYSLLVGAFAAFVFNAWLIAGFSANVFFIQLNRTAKDRFTLGTWIHHLSHCMAQLPGGFLGNSNPLGQKYRGDTFT